MSTPRDGRYVFRVEYANPHDDTKRAVQILAEDRSEATRAADHYRKNYETLHSVVNTGVTAEDFARGGGVAT